MFGVIPPWYNDPVEVMAFNLFAMSCEEEEEPENDIEE